MENQVQGFLKSMGIATAVGTGVQLMKLLDNRKKEKSKEFEIREVLKFACFAGCSRAIYSICTFLPPQASMPLASFTALHYFPVLSDDIVEYLLFKSVYRLLQLRTPWGNLSANSQWKIIWPIWEFSVLYFLDTAPKTNLKYCRMYNLDPSRLRKFYSLSQENICTCTEFNYHESKCFDFFLNEVIRKRLTYWMIFGLRWQSIMHGIRFAVKRKFDLKKFLMDSTKLGLFNWCCVTFGSLWPCIFSKLQSQFGKFPKRVLLVVQNIFAIFIEAKLLIFLCPPPILKTALAVLFWRSFMLIVQHFRDVKTMEKNAAGVWEIKKGRIPWRTIPNEYLLATACFLWLEIERTSKLGTFESVFASLTRS